MAATGTRGRSPAPASKPPMTEPPPAVRTHQDPATTTAHLAPVVAALIRTIQAAFASAAADLGRGDMGANAALVRLGAHRDDVETLRAFLAAQPRPAHIPEEF